VLYVLFNTFIFLVPLYQKQLVLFCLVEVVALQYENIGTQLKSSLKSGLKVRGFSLGSGRNIKGFYIHIVIPILYKKSSVSAAFQ